MEERGKGGMNKREMKTASDGDLIVEYVRACADLASNFVLDRGIIQIQRNIKNMEAEILKRGILTQKQIDRICM